MNIGITTFGGDGGKSGISQYIINLLRQFSSFNSGTNYDVVVYEDEQDIFIDDPNILHPITCSDRIRHPITNILWHQTSLPGLCSRKKFDALFLPAANRRVPLRSPCPTIGTVHDFSSIHVEGKYDASRMFYITRVLPFLIRRLDHVITVSESSKKDILEYARVPEDRVTVIPLAADQSLYKPGDQSDAVEVIGPKYGIRSPYILYISRIEHPGKNHIRLIKAFNHLKKEENIPHQLVLAGSDWDRAEEVHREASESESAADILFTGFTDHSDLPALYNGAELFVFPSLYEGFGLPVLEAMSSGTPVACSNISSIPEVAGDATVLFDPYSIENIQKSILGLIQDNAARKEFAAKGYERSKSFSWQKTAEKTLEVIRKTVADGK